LKNSIVYFALNVVLILKFCNTRRC